MQLRLPGFHLAALQEVGVRVRDLYAEANPHEQRIRSVCDDAYIDVLARAVIGDLGGRVGDLSVADQDHVLEKLVVDLRLRPVEEVDDHAAV